jgi:hypothetical protein
MERVAGDPQVLIEVRLLFRKAESQPFREDLMVTVAKCAVSVFRPQNPRQGLVMVSTACPVAKRCQKNQTAEYGRYLK